MKKVFLTLLLISSALYAQDLYEFSLSGGGGLSTLRYEPTLGKQKNGIDKLFGIGYTYFFSRGFGLGTGLEVGFYSSEFNLKNHDIQYTAKDIEGSENNFSSTVDNYKEEQNIVMLQIPLMLQFQFRSAFYMMMGAKIAIPVSGSGKGSGNIYNTGCYESENYCYGDAADINAGNDHSDVGFGPFKDKKIDVKEDFKTSILASVEAGKKWKLDEDIALYIGAYFDYGFSNIYVKKKAEDLPPMVEYNNRLTQSFALNSMFDSKWSKGGVSNTFLDKVTIMAVGIKIRIAPAYGTNHFDKKEESENPLMPDIKRLEEENLRLEKELERKTAYEKSIAEQQESLARAEKLLNESRLIYEKAQQEQNVSSAEDAMRISAEKLQIEEEIKRISAEKAKEEESKDSVPLAEKTELPVPIMQPGQQSAGIYAVQVAVLLEESRAATMVNSLKQNGYNAYYKEVNNPGKLTGRYYRVRVGYFNAVPEAENFAKTSLVKSGYANWWIDKTANDTKGY